ncbi:MAG: hypothetical protein JNK99_07715 [Candidatus Accumulibacter sp.]|nr:hypothetical protein [Accumulibacter sp.]
MPALLADAHAEGPWRADTGNTSGWQLMTPDERIEHQRRMRSFATYDDCKEYQARQHAEMVERARRAGIVLQPRQESACERLRARSRLP